MSKERLKQIFDAVQGTPLWSMQLIKVKAEREGVTYHDREICLRPEGSIRDFAHQLSKYYLSDSGIDSFASVDDYTGDVVGNVIYKLQRDNNLIQNGFDALINEAANPDTEGPIGQCKYSAYMILGTISLQDEQLPIKFVSMQSPITVMNNKFLWRETNTLNKVSEPILSLKKTVDVIIAGDTVYMLSMAGENLFGMERAYKAVCKNKVNDIIACDFLTNAEQFEKTATTGQNPRRFVSYNQSRLDALKNANRRKSLAKKFGLQLSDTRINTDDKQTTERLIKFLCNKAMLDPLDSSPVEVAAAKSWK